MAVTLEQLKNRCPNELDKQIYDTYQKSNFFWNNLVWHQAVAPVGGGATLGYSYNRLSKKASAAFRKINEEYTANEAETKLVTVELKPFGGRFNIDRVIANTGGIVDEVAFQMEQKILASADLFNDAVINGDAATGNSFDGLEKALKGTSTEFNASGTEIDLTTADAIKANSFAFLETLEDFLSNLDGMPSALIGNAALINKIKSVGRHTAMYQQSLDNFGRQVATYNGIPLVALGSKPGTNDPIIATKTGLTDLYAVRIGMDGFHGVTFTSDVPMINKYLPDFTTAGAVKAGEVEMVAAVALKNTKAAGVLRKIKVSA